MKVALYARVSMDEKGEREQSLDNQIGPLKEWAANQKAESVIIYSDKESGANPNRAGFLQMMEDARLRKFDTLLIWKMDRFSRESMLNVISYLKRLRGYNVAVKSLTESWLDTTVDNPSSDLILAVMAWVAEQERRKISDRTKAGIQRRRNIGQWRGGRPKKRVAYTSDKALEPQLQKTVV